MLFAFGPLGSCFGAIRTLAYGVPFASFASNNRGSVHEQYLKRVIKNSFQLVMCPVSSTGIINVVGRRQGVAT